MKLIAIAAAAAGLTFAFCSAQAAESGTCKRPNGDTVKVSVAGGKLFCKIEGGDRNDFEMCHGMTKSGAAWQGANMKHPSMPGFMTFNGTVTFTGSGASIKGCAVGESMCDAENWTKL